MTSTLTIDAPSEQSEWRRNGLMLLAGMVGYSFFTVPTATLGLFMAPLQAEFGWSRTEVAAGFTLFALVTIPLLPFMGMAVDRYGARRLALPGLALTSAVFAAFGLSSGSMLQWFATWVLFALVSLLTSMVVWTSAVSGAFGKNRGMALALLLSGSAIAQALAPATASWLIDSFGWRAAYVSLAVGWGGLALILVATLFRSSVQATVPSTNSKVSPNGGVGGLTMGEAFRNLTICRIALSTLLQTLLTAAFMVHMVPILVSLGLDRTQATSFAIILAVAAIAGKLVTGWLVDRVGVSLLPALCYGGPAVAFFFMLRSSGSPPLLALAIAIQGYSAGAALQLTTYLTTRYAGLRNFATIFGIVSMLLGVAAGVGPLIAAATFDAYGDYRAFLWMSTVVGLCAGLAAVALGPYPVFDERVRTT